MQHIANNIHSARDKISKLSFGITATNASIQGICLFCKSPVLPLLNSLDDIHNWEEYQLCPSCVNGGKDV